MALPTSGALTLANIQTEFGGTNPIGLNEYYAGAGLVPAGTSGTYGAVPSSGALQVKNFYGTKAFTPIYIEDVFSTYLYKGAGTTQTITNGIDLAGKGGLVWLKRRDTAQSHGLFDTARGGDPYLCTDLTTSQYNFSNGMTYNADGFTNKAGGYFGGGGDGYALNYVSWTFRKQPKFFDVVTYTGDGVAGRTVAHSLGSTPGCIIVKAYTATGYGWRVYHAGLGATQYLSLEGTAAATTSSTTWNNTAPTSTNFTVGTDVRVNESGVPYIAYVFAHNAGGFGLTGTDNVISCGTFTTDASGLATVNLGYEPQWILFKKTSGSAENWFVRDVARGWSHTTNAFLYPNLSDAEVVSTGDYTSPTATGFQFGPTSGAAAVSSTYIYIAIRRGPMKVPTDATKVFAPGVYTGNNTYDFSNGLTASFAPDLVWVKGRDNYGTRGNANMFVDKLRGVSAILLSNSSREEISGNSGVFRNTGFGVQQYTNLNDSNGRVDFNLSPTNYVGLQFARAPGFFDEVCYKGTGSATTVTHGLKAVPELIIVKNRSSAVGGAVYSSASGATKYLSVFDSVNAVNPAATAAMWNDTAPTSSVFSVGTNSSNNSSGNNYVAWLFATCPGVSKVGSYTGTGAAQTINCGFTAGARFILIKSTDASYNDWYFWNSARGITTGNDPYLLMDSVADETTSTNYIAPQSTGFGLTSTATDVNTSGNTYMYIAIA